MTEIFFKMIIHEENFMIRYENILYYYDFLFKYLDLVALLTGIVNLKFHDSGESKPTFTNSFGKKNN